MKKIYLLSTDHLEDSLWFHEEEDFRVAMNYVAIQAVCSPDVSVLAFVLMSNHVHFVLAGTRRDVEEFLKAFKQRYSLYLRRKYCFKEFLRDISVDVRLIPLGDEALERAIAYVQMNPVAANICSHPSQYPWGTGSIFFNQSVVAGKSVEDFSGRALRQLLRSDSNVIPKGWNICDMGYLLPQSYVDVAFVEKCYRTPRRMNFFLQNSSKARKRMESAERNLPSFRDQIILTAIPDLCRSLFQKDGICDLSTIELSELLRQIRFRFSADVKQIARVCSLPYAETVKLLDEI